MISKNQPTHNAIIRYDSALMKNHNRIFSLKICQAALIRIFFVFAIFTPIHSAMAKGAFNYFWKLGLMPPASVVASTPTEAYPISSVVYTPPTGGYYGTVIGSQCIGSVSKKGSKRATYWLEYPAAGKSDTGLNWFFSFNKMGELIGPEPSEQWGGRHGFMVMAAAQTQPEKIDSQKCRPIGSVWQDVNLPHGQPLHGTLKLNKDELFSGRHTIILDFYNAVEEHFSDGDAGNLYTRAAEFTQLSTPTQAIIILDIKTRCDVDLKSLAISHGTVANNIERHKAISENKSTLSCENGSATATITIKGATPVSGRPANVTKCGDFECELMLNVNESMDVVTKKINVNQHDKVFITPTSTLHLYPGAQGGSFEGGGVVEIVFE